LQSTANQNKKVIHCHHWDPNLPPAAFKSDENKFNPHLRKNRLWKRINIGY
jgi:hypothetical protein